MWINKIIIIKTKFLNQAIHKIMCIDEKKNKKKIIVKKKTKYLPTHIARCSKFSSVCLR